MDEQTERTLAIIQDLIWGFSTSGEETLEHIEGHCGITHDEFFRKENHHNLGFMPSPEFIDNESMAITKAARLAFHWLRIKSGGDSLLLSDPNNSVNNLLDIVKSLFDEFLNQDPNYHKLYKEWYAAKEKRDNKFVEETLEIRESRARATGQL